MKTINFAMLIIFLTLVVTANATTDQSDKLMNLIPGFFGGDGITLGDTSNENGVNHAEDFKFATASDIGLLNNNISQEIKSLPIGTSSPGGRAYNFDPNLGTYIASTKGLGPLIGESSKTIGKGKWSIASSVSRYSYSEFNGENLHNYSVVTEFPKDGSSNANVDVGFKQDNMVTDFDINLDVLITSFYATYGISDVLDVNMVLPIVSVKMDATAGAWLDESLNNTPGTHSLKGTPEKGQLLNGKLMENREGSAAGVGDIMLTLKYNNRSTDSVSLSSGIIIKLATGDKNNFLGTGTTAYSPYGVLDVVLYKNMLFHGNLGFEFSNNGTGDNILHALTGITFGGKSFTTAIEVVGAHAVNGDGIGDERTDIGWGLKWSPVKQHIISLNLLVPLNNQGLRSDLISSVGYAATF